MHRQGYVAIRLPRGKAAYTLEHIAVWEATHGPLPRSWVVHHLNGLKADNRPENLAGMARNLHHTAPRQALVPYEERIRLLEDRISELEAQLPPR